MYFIEGGIFPIDKYSFYPQRSLGPYSLWFWHLNARACPRSGGYVHWFLIPKLITILPSRMCSPKRSLVPYSHLCWRLKKPLLALGLANISIDFSNISYSLFPWECTNRLFLPSRDSTNNTPWQTGTPLTSTLLTTHCPVTTPFNYKRTQTDCIFQDLDLDCDTLLSSFHSLSPSL